MYSEISNKPYTVGDLIQTLSKFNKDDMIIVYDEGCATNLYEVVLDEKDHCVYLG